MHVMTMGSSMCQLCLYSQHVIAISQISNHTHIYRHCTVYSKEGTVLSRGWPV